MILGVLGNIFPRFDPRSADPGSAKSPQELLSISEYQSIAGRDLLKLLERPGQSPVDDANIELWIQLLGMVHVTALELEQIKDLALFWMSVELQAQNYSNQDAWQRFVREVEWLFDAKPHDQRAAARQEPKKYSWQDLAA